MKLTHVLIACAISICPALAAQNQPDQASGQPIEVFITASHKDGLPASLTTTDIAVSIDKKTAQVTDVRSAKDDPLLFALLVDVSKSDGEEAKTIRELGVQLFKALAVGQNRGYLVLFNDNVAMSQTPMSPERAELNLNTVKFDRSTALYDAIAQTSTYKFGAPENAKNMRRVIVLISDGEDNSSHIPHTKAEEAAQKQHVAIFPVLIPSTFTGPVSRGPERMNDFSRATGGRLVKADKVPETVQSLLSALREQWLISLVSAEATYKKTLTLQVKSEAKDIKILAPSQIFLP